MKKLLAVAVVMLLFTASQADAQKRREARTMTARTATYDYRSGQIIPAVTRLHPVIGSINRTSHFNNPFTHKARYGGVLYNPLLGSFNNYTFRR